MSPPRFRLQAVMRCEPEACLARVREAVDGVGGFILDITPLSNLALTFSLDLAPGALAPLAAALREQGAAVDAVDSDHDGGTGTLSVQLVHDQGDGKMVVPAVPG